MFPVPPTSKPINFCSIHTNTKELKKRDPICIQNYIWCNPKPNLTSYTFSRFQWLKLDRSDTIGQQPKPVHQEHLKVCSHSPNFSSRSPIALILCFMEFTEYTNNNCLCQQSEFSFFFGAAKIICNTLESMLPLKRYIW